MIAEVIGAGVVVGGLTTLAVYAITAARRAGDEKARAAELAARVESIGKQNTDLATQLKDEQEKTNALDAAIAKYAAEAVGPVAGSFAGLLQAAADARARRSARPAGVPDVGDPVSAPEADRRDDTGLLRPGE